ncbi:MAG TPA: anthranilate synthase component I [Ktedonobacteraceae bacterium]|nr:anthranilate synthase component I [Ktedonobacteraceae bacterium]
MIMYYPTFDEIRQLRDAEMVSHVKKRGRPLLPLYRDLLVDLETPVSAYCKTAQGPYSFLLESVTGGERVGRYSFIGIDPYLVITHRGEKAVLYKREGTMGHDKAGHGNSGTSPYAGLSGTSSEEVPCHDPLRLIEAELGQYRLVAPASTSQDELPQFHGGAVGYLSYDVVSRFEHLPVPQQNELELPLAIFCFTETVLVFDHVKHRVRIVTHLHLDAPDLDTEYQRGIAILNNIQERLRQPVRLPEEPTPVYDKAALQVTSNRTQSEFEEMVRRSIAYIQAGDVFQVVPSQRLSRHVNAAPFTIYRALRAINPSPYMFYLDMRDFHIVGASPELLVRFEDNEVTIRPIAGTRPRGVDRQGDQAFAEELKNDPKERAEHVMLVDLARNDVGRVSIPGSIQVSEFMEIERYSHVMHLVSNITGQLRPDVTPYDALRAGFPAGTVSGAPKIRAMEIISELEGEQRGVYAGAVGYFSHSGNQETAIALRTMVIQDGRAYIQAGCGVVADSNPAAEYQESLNKARALLRALDEAEILANEHRKTSTPANNVTTEQIVVVH